MKGFRQRSLAVLVAFLSVLLLTGCYTENSVHMGYRGSATQKHWNASFAVLSGTEARNLKLNQGQVLSLFYEIGIESGKFRVDVRDPSGNALLTLDQNGKGQEDVQAGQDGWYKIQLTADGAKGSYVLDWEIR